MEKINTDKKTLKKFGITMGLAFLVITLIILFKHKHSIIPAAALSAAFFLLAYTLPGILKPAYVFWMKLAFILSWINTRLVLIIIFYLFITPIAVILKVCGMDLLDKRITKTKQSYWLPKEKDMRGAGDYERQF